MFTERETPVKASSTLAPVFYCAELAELDAAGELSEQESRHASGSRRLRPGDSIDLFDGVGTTARASIESITRRRQITFLIEEIAYVEKSDRRLWLATAIPKGDRQTVLLDMATQLGVTDVLPVRFQHSVWRQPESPARWHRIVLEAGKQSRRHWLPKLHQPVDLADLFETMKTVDQVLLAHQYGDSIPAMDPGSNVLAIIGPEGGLAAAELDLLIQAGARPVAVTANVLRVETAAVALVTLLSS